MDALGEELAYARARIAELEKTRLHETFDRLLEGCIVLRRDWTVLYVNQAAARHLRQAPEELVGRTLVDALPGIQESPIFAAYRRAMGERQAEALDASFTFADGTESWFRLSIEPVPEGICVLSLDVTDHVAAEAQLRQRRDQLGILARGRTAELEAVFDALAMPVMVFDATGRAVRANASSRATFGVDPTALDAAAYDALVLGELAIRYPDGQPLVASELPVHRALRGEVLHRLPLVLRTAQGAEAVLEASAIPLKEGTQVVGAVVAWHDVSQRAHAEQALRESEQRFRLALRNAPVTVAVQDRQLRFIWAYNQRTADTAAILGKTDRDLFTPEEAERLVQLKRRALTSGNDVHEQLWFTRGGQRMFLDLFIEPMRDVHGLVIGIGVATVDLTHEKLAEEALRHAHDELDLKVRARTAELIAANRTLRMISACNEALVRATDETALVRDVCQIIHDLGGFRTVWVGYAEADPARSVRTVAAIGLDEGEVDRSALSWADDDRGRHPTGTCIRTGEPQVGRDFLADPALARWRADAEQHGYRSAVALPLQAGGKVLGALTLYAESPDAFGGGQVGLLTELADDMAFGIVAIRVQLERDRALELAEERAGQLRALAMELGQAEHRERERLARVLHDHLQQLLVGAKLGIAAIEDKLRTREKQEAIQRVVGILDEAIQASRSLTAELSPPALHAKGLGAGLTWLAEQMQVKHGLAVEVCAAADVDPGVTELRVVLFEAVRELLFNVVKHAGVKSAAVSLTREPPDRLVVTVTDRGVGFDARALEAGPTSGTGFGLFHIRERLSYLGGRLEIDSTPGQGSCFTLVAPAAIAAAVTPAAASPIARAEARGASVAVARDEEGGRGQRRLIRVLLADDHPVMREGLVRVFAEQPDMEVVGEAGDGVEALELANRLRPDVVVMDVGMPRASGIDVTKIIRAELPAVRVVGLSMHEDADMAGAMRKAGAVAYLTKDGPIDHLINAVRAAVSVVERRKGSDRHRLPPKRPGRRKRRRARAARRRR